MLLNSGKEEGGKEKKQEEENASEAEDMIDPDQGEGDEGKGKYFKQGDDGYDATEFREIAWPQGLEEIAEGKAQRATAAECVEDGSDIEGDDAA